MLFGLRISFGSVSTDILTLWSGTNTEKARLVQTPKHHYYLYYVKTDVPLPCFCRAFQVMKEENVRKHETIYPVGVFMVLKLISR